MENMLEEIIADPNYKVCLHSDKVCHLVNILDTKRVQLLLENGKVACCNAKDLEFFVKGPALNGWCKAPNFLKI